MKKIIKYIIIFICLFNLTNINRVNVQKTDIVLVNETNEINVEDTGDYNFNTLVVVEIFVV